MGENSNLQKQSFWVSSLQQSLENVTGFKETTNLYEESGKLAPNHHSSS